jgi:hypothetical protein
VIQFACVSGLPLWRGLFIRSFVESVGLDTNRFVPTARFGTWDCRILHSNRGFRPTVVRHQGRRTRIKRISDSANSFQIRWPPQFSVEFGARKHLRCAA